MNVEDAILKLDGEYAVRRIEGGHPPIDFDDWNPSRVAAISSYSGVTQGIAFTSLLRRTLGGTVLSDPGATCSGLSLMLELDNPDRRKRHVWTVWPDAVVELRMASIRFGGIMTDKVPGLVEGLIFRPSTNGRCTYNKTAKQALVELCKQPGVSVAALALTHDLSTQRAEPGARECRLHRDRFQGRHGAVDVRALGAMLDCLAQRVCLLPAGNV